MREYTEEYTWISKHDCHILTYLVDEVGIGHEYNFCVTCHGIQNLSELCVYCLYMQFCTVTAGSDRHKHM